MLGVTSPHSMELITESGTITGVRIDGGNGTFTWNNTILVNNVAKTVEVTDLGTDVGNFASSDSDSGALSGETARLLQFVIDENKPQNIFWDPTNSFDEDKILDNGAASIAVSAAALVAAALAIFA